MAFRWDSVSLQNCVDDPALVAAAFKLADTDGSGAIYGPEAVLFFGKSGLPNAALSRIWKTATHGTGSIRDAAAFTWALKLVAAELASLRLAAAADSGGGGTGPSSSASSGTVGGMGFDMTPAERKKYLAHYASIDAVGVGHISHEAATAFLIKAKLPRAEIQVLVEKCSQGEVHLSKDAFCSAMHETYKAIRAGSGSGRGGTSVSRPPPPPKAPQPPLVPAAFAPDTASDGFVSFGDFGGGGGGGGG
eukprot:CAMPEP_0181373278 /NCGR_PEP_ID=MMETSP1106-20121128/15284_1 /TAXON_ID=81844 /ORGANISM="Mantoniella antarctica, Strain SL-175" /LENGTH=247 /DNA_ID=CAMNT_0023490947 /DNA_START=111 /DNA_END=851 /DNA_ORIENTATION=+